MQEIKTFKKLYSVAERPENLPWYHAEPTTFLAEITADRSPGQALDIGCGAGTDSIYLAEQGWDVTCLDFVESALEMTGRRAKEMGVSLSFVQADVTSWNNTETYDLVLDAGVLHNMKRGRVSAYRQRLLNWLADEGDFVLVHWEKQSAADWRPVGPRRITREKIQSLFAPELKEKAFSRHVSTGLPLIVGPTMSQAYYWFRRET